MKDTKHRDHKYKDSRNFMELIKHFEIRRVYVDWHRFYSYIHMWFDHHSVSHRLVITDIEKLVEMFDEITEVASLIPVKHYGW